MEKYIKIKNIVENFYSNGNKITTKEYLDFFNSSELNQSEWKLLTLIYNTPDNSSTATELAAKLNYKGHQAINLKFKRIAEKIANHTNKFPYSRNVNKYWWWTLLATGYKKEKYFHWKLRPELVTAINIFEEIQPNKNIVNWKQIIRNWIQKTRILKKYEFEFLTFFDKVINLAVFPDRAYFGTNNSTISIVIGHLYLGVYIHSGNDKGIGMIVETEFNDISGVICKPIKSTLAKTSPHKLFWLWISDVSNLCKILEEKEIWQSFQKASKLVIETPQGKTIRKREKNGKIVLTKLANPKEIISEEVYVKILQTEIENAKKVSKEKRKKKLKEAPEIPEKITITAIGFKRNPYIIIEVLERANGFCELCEMEAPFLRKKDNTPFLEVHHIQPLAEGGKDTVKNTVALCPNCHREAHFGINKHKLKKTLITAYNRVTRNDK